MESVTTHIPFLSGLMMLLAAGGILVPLLQRLTLPPVLAYLVAGLLIGPHGIGLLVPQDSVIRPYILTNSTELNVLAEFGVIFLLFLIGLELSPQRLWQLRRFIFGLGSTQIILTTATIAPVALYFGNTLAASLLLGFSLAMSSTAIVMQMLAERHALAQPIGRVSFSVLLMQDLTVVPLLVIAGVIGDGGNLLQILGVAALKAVGMLLFIMVTGLLLLRPLFRLAGKAVGEESFLALVLLVAIGTSALTGAVGLSMSLGAFLAGMLLAETEFRHAIGVYISPFKGLLLGVFFMSVGMGFDLRAVVGNLYWLLASLVGLVLIKACIVALAGRLLAGLSWPLALEAGLLLGQAGEFAFIVIGIAMARGVLPADVGQFMLVLTALSMFVSPALANLGEKLQKRLSTEPASPLMEETPPLEGHILIIGYGRIGRVIAEVLTAENIAWAAVDHDSLAVAAARKLGRPVWFGDARYAPMLERMSINRARNVILTTDAPEVSEAIIKSIRTHWKTVPLCARTRDRSHARRLQRTYKLEVAPENLELALHLATLAMRSLQIDEPIIQHRIELVRTTALEGKA